MGTPVQRWLVAVIGGVLVIAGCWFLTSRFDSQPVRSPAMWPTLDPEESVLVDSAAAQAAGVRRGDVVLVRAIEAWPRDGAIRNWPGPVAELSFVLRVAGVGGDTVRCCDAEGRLAVNGQPLDEAYASDGNAVHGEFSVTVPEGRLFLLGDARNLARDSRVQLDHAAGTVPAASVLGRVVAVHAPPWRVRLIAGWPGPALLLPVAAVLAGSVLVGCAGWVLLRRAAARLAAGLRRIRKVPAPAPW